MRFNSGLISCFFLASAVLAGSDQSHQLNLLERSPKVLDSSVWAGARLGDNDGTFNSVTGILVAPTLSGDPGSAVAVWMGIDGDGDVVYNNEAVGCQNYFVCGILSTVTSGGTQHQAFMRWFPHPPLDFPFDITTGDRIQITFNVYDWMSGTLIFNNLSRGQSVTKNFKCASLLCGRLAEWMVGRVAAGGENLPLANFSRLLIASASAGARGGLSFGPAATTLGITNIYQLTTDHGGVIKPVADSDSVSFDA
ncbi:peptidase A4 family-domain-containing protein [Boletus reticuloceps]|uniref:Peptidase A4 family-domain-containing protein n=1 Tax=Boletus reticuloceps TaxID=495285 RepID=A0A8I2Z250_9AGAM|nr:peptidase A4 family-domain-containing protein [Boletus reticuloceps]